MNLTEVRELVQLRLPEVNSLKRVAARCHSVEDFRQAAQRKLPRAVFDYVDGGADTEETVAANRARLLRWAFHPQVLRDVSSPDLSVELFGRRLPVPLGLAPTGYTRMVHPLGEEAVAAATAVRGLPYGLSTVGSTSIEDLAATGHQRLWFQLYVLKDRAHTRSLVSRAADAGFEALEVSVDTAVGGHRGRDVRNGFTIPPQLSVRTITDIGLHMSYWTSMLRSPKLTFANLVPSSGTGGGSTGAGGTGAGGTGGGGTGAGGTGAGGTGAGGTGAGGTDIGASGLTTGTVAHISELFDPSFNWADLEDVRRWWKGPLLLKGPVGPRDALRAVELGVDGIHISNHGGRQLDRSAATIDLVRPVRQAVGDRATVVFDSGVRHGADMIVAIARGADICMVGRPYLYGLAALGEAGVALVIDLLTDQFCRTLQLLGVTSVAQLRSHADELVTCTGQHQPASGLGGMEAALI